MDDVRAVMDAVGSERAVMWSGQEGTRMTTLFAATYPERTSGLVVLDPTAKGLPTPDYPWAPTEAEWGETLRGVREHWGERDFLEGMIRSLAPTWRTTRSSATGSWRTCVGASAPAPPPRSSA